MKAVNLIPGDDRGGAVITAGRSGGGVFAVAGLLAGLALLALLYGLADRKISHDSSEVVSLNARAQQAQVRAGELAPYTSFLQMREQRVQSVAALVSSRFDWAQAFHELGRVLPAGKVSLGSIEGTIGSIASATPPASSPGARAGASAASGPTVTSATPPGSIPTFKLTGCASSQAEVALMLQRLRLINGVSEVSLQSSTQSASSGAGAGTGSGCEGGNPAFTAQVTFDALPAVSMPSTSTATPSTVASSTSPTTSPSVPSASAPASNASGANAPAASAASTSPSAAVR
jgi:Tfp pilus assembly protein PilN